MSVNPIAEDGRMHTRSCVPGKQRIVVESSAQSNRLGSWRIGRWNGNRRQSQRRLDFQRRSGGHHRGISWLRRAAQRVRRAIRNRKSNQGNKERRKYQKPDSSGEVIATPSQNQKF